jgi:hypothetical protein
MRLSVTGATVFHWTQAQVLGDYLLLWIGPGRVDYSLSKLYLVAWKTGLITLVSFFHFISLSSVIIIMTLWMMMMTAPGISSGDVWCNTGYDIQRCPCARTT